MQTFKVGDWITLLDKGIYQIKAISKDSTKLFLDTKESPQSDNWWNIAQCKLWQPQPGEWCWFWNDDNTLVLSQFAHGLSNGAKFTSKNLMYQYCEPFIGQLPSILQSQPKG